MGWMLVGRQLVPHPLRRQHRRTVGVRVLAHGGAVHVGVVRVSGVHVGSWWHALHHVASERVRRRHPLLFLSPVAEPHPHHFLFQLFPTFKRCPLLRAELSRL